MLLGIDISHHQKPNAIDWQSMVDEKIKFCIVRATYGVKQDSTFQTHLKNAANSGLVTGAYHFLRFKPSQSAEAQAEEFLEALEPVSYLLSDMLPPTIDLEDNKYDEQIKSAADKKKYLGMVNTWLEIVEKELGKSAIVYTRANFFDDSLGSFEGFGVRPLWVAHYTSKPAPNIPKAWDKHTIWQFTEHGKLNGYNGNLDVNRFDGNTEQLDALVKGTNFILPIDYDLADVEASFTQLGETGFPVERVNAGGLNLRSDTIVSSQTWIATLPLGHDVEVIKRNIDGKWAQVRTFLNGQGVSGFVAQRHLRKRRSDEIERLVSSAVEQWLRFKRGAGKETIYPYYNYIGEMWEALGYQYDGRDTKQYWSAAAISYFIEKAGSGYSDFKRSIRHSTYIKDGIEKRESGTSASFWGYKITEKKPEIGDLICQWRVNKTDYNSARTKNSFPSHTDLVVRIEDNHVFALGGNVGHSVDLKKYQLRADGKLKNERSVFAILKNRLG